jgi:hypothetical protein
MARPRTDLPTEAHGRQCGQLPSCPRINMLAVFRTPRTEADSKARAAAHHARRIATSLLPSSSLRDQPVTGAGTVAALLNAPHTLGYKGPALTLLGARF